MIKLLLLIVCSLTSGSIAASEMSTNTLIRFAPLKHAPEIDGKILPGEWNQAVSSFGGISDKTGLMTVRPVTYYFGYDDNNLYFACDSEAPKMPQKLTKNDTVTLTLLPPGAERPLCFTVNHEGKGNLPAGARSAGMVTTELERGIVTPHWHFESVIPLASLNLKKIDHDRAWGLQMSREFRQADETALWHNSSRPGELGTFIPDPEAPVSGFDGFGHMLWDKTSNYYMKFRVGNFTGADMLFLPDCFMVADAMSNPTLNPGDSSGFVKGKKIYRVAQHIRHLKSGAEAPLEQVIWAQFPGTIRTLVGNITSKDGMTAYYKRMFSWNLSDKRNLKWLSPGLPKLDSAFYPSLGNKLLVRLTGVSDNRSNATRENKGSAPNGFSDVTVSVKGPGNKIFHVFKNLEKSHGFQQSEKLGDLPYGDYTVEMSAIRNDGKKFSDLRTFSVRKFDWQNNRLGMDRVIVPPFTPIRVDRNKMEVHFLQTGYRISNGFWNAVYAEGENVLASPVELLLDGKKFTQVSCRIASAEPDRVVCESVIRCGKLDITVIQDYDYDGFCKVTLKFRPQGLMKLNRLELVMPLKREEVKYFNMFIHPWNRGESYEIPSGNGVVWDSFKATKKSSRPGGWTPYCWIGGNYKGFCWIADSFRYYSLDKTLPCQQIMRTSDAVIYQLDIVNKFTVWNSSSPFEIVMGFQPSPVKPQAAGYRKMGTIMYDKAWYPRNCQVFSRACGLGLRNNVFNPPQKDYSFFDYVVSLKDIPPEKRNRADYDRKCREYYRKHLPEHLQRNMGSSNAYLDKLNWHFSRTAGKLLMYTDPLAISCFWPEDEMYKAEWSAWTFPVEEPFYHEYLSRLPKSRIDKLIHDEWRAVRRGFDGVNFDCFGQGGGYNTENGIAWIDENGDMQSNCELLAWREIVRRTAVMLHVEGKLLYGVPWVDVHATNGMVIPVCSFASTTTATELGGRRGEYQDRFLESQWLADILGIQSGIVPFPIMTCPDKKNELDSMLAAMFAYGVMNIYDQGVALGSNPWIKKVIDIVFDFGYGNPEVEIYPYWGKRPQPVSHNAKDVRMTVVKRQDGKTLLLFGNLGEKTNIKFDPSGLGYSNFMLTDPETGHAIEKPEISIGRRSYAMILIERH